MHRLEAEQTPQFLVINQPIPRPGSLNLIVSGKRPLGRVTYNAGSNHIEVHINKALNQMTACFNCRRMITVFPESAFPILPLIKLLGCSSRNQLNRFRNYISAAVVPDEEMDMIGCNRIIEHAQAVALPGLEKPPKPPVAVYGKLEKKFLLVTSMGDVPDVTGQLMSIFSRHTWYNLQMIFSW